MPPHRKPQPATFKNWSLGKKLWQQIGGLMEHSHRFFSNKECKYFPCHETLNESEFNCIFCFCPLYHLGDECGGIIKYNKAGTVKLCTDCYLPHTAEYYDIILSKLKEKNQISSKQQPK